MNIKMLNIENINEIIELIWNVQIEFNQIPVMFQDEESKEYFKNSVLSKMNGGLKFFGAFLDDKMIGVIGFEENCISYLYVLKEYQRNKVGTKFIRFSLEILREYDEIVIDSIDDAKKFYRKNGFRNKDNQKYTTVMEYKRKRFKSIFKIN